MRKSNETGAVESGMSSVGNALRVLDLLESGSQLRLVDVARSLGVANSTAHRLLTTLRDGGYVGQDPGSSRYVPGPSALRLARRINAERMLRHSALPHLQELSHKLNETVHLQILVGPDVLFLASAEDNHQLRVPRLAGTRSPAHASAGGKLLLAQLTNDKVHRLFNNGLVPVTPRTVVDFDRLFSVLQEVRRRGYAVNAGETEPGVYAVAVPVVDADDAIIAALSLAAPVDRLPSARISRILPYLRATSASMSSSFFGVRREEISTGR
jgi:DNA-binding IclR family transcriptional regulator